MNATPVPQSLPMLPKTMLCTLTAVPSRRNVVLSSVDDCAGVPSCEDRLDGFHHLYARVLRNSLPFPSVQRLVTRNDVLSCPHELGIQFAVVGGFTSSKISSNFAFSTSIPRPKTSG